MSKTLTLLVVTALGQLAVLAQIYSVSWYPALVGTEVRIPMEPFDPRDYFMGQYAALRYGFSTFSPSQLQPAPRRIRKGESVYVVLTEESGVWKSGTPSLQRPAGGVFIQGVVSQSWDPHRGSWSIPIAFGIERYYTSPENARRVEQELRGGKHFARIAVAPNGKASLLGIEKARN